MSISKNRRLIGLVIYKIQILTSIPFKRRLVVLNTGIGPVRMVKWNWVLAHSFWFF
jgi:hypothetical protein